MMVISNDTVHIVISISADVPAAPGKHTAVRPRSDWHRRPGAGLSFPVRDHSGRGAPDPPKGQVDESVDLRAACLPAPCALGYSPHLHRHKGGSCPHHNEKAQVMA
jgi:hypothetical protein